MKKIIFLFIVVLFASCNKEKKNNEETDFVEPEIIYKYGYKLNDYIVIHDTIRKNENFSEILGRHHVDYAKVLEIVNKIREQNDESTNGFFISFITKKERDD